MFVSMFSLLRVGECTCYMRLYTKHMLPAKECHNVVSCQLRTECVEEKSALKVKQTKTPALGETTSTIESFRYH